MRMIRIAEPQPLILYQTALMELHYDAQADILRVKWADFDDLNWLEVEYNFRVIRDSVRWYFIKRILVDSSGFEKMPDKALLHRATSLFLDSLYGTSVRKYARVRCASAAREALANEVFNQLDPDNYFMEFRTFATETEALDWLLEDQVLSLS